MILSLLIIIVTLTIFFVLKEKFDERPRLFRITVTAIMILTIGTVLTLELFIYVDARVTEFREAISGVPVILVIVVFLALLYFAWWLLMMFGGFNRDQFQQFVQDTFVPKAKETFRDVADTGRVGWRGLMRSFGNPFRRTRPSATGEGHADPQKDP